MLCRGFKRCLQVAWESQIICRTKPKLSEVIIINNKLKIIRKALPEAIIVIGSGTDSENVKELSKYADAAIVGTCLKEDNEVKMSRVKEFMKKARKD